MDTSREQRMRDAVALWYVDQRTAADLVYAACDLLAAGVEGPSLTSRATTTWPKR